MAVKGICIAAGLNTSRPDRDNGIDLLITKGGTQRAPYLAAQIKSCSILRERDGCWQYDLDAKAFDRLSAEPGLGPPEYLFLVKVPPDPSEYLVNTHTETIFRAAVYWLSLEGMGDGRKYASSRRISVPRDNLLTAAVLAELFDKAAGEYNPLPPSTMRGGI